MINFKRTIKTGHILSLFLLLIAGISAGCTTKAETMKPPPPNPAKKETAVTTQTPGYTTNQDPYSERQFDGDLEFATPAPPKSATALKKADYEKIKPGMTLEEVENLLGETGMLVSTMDVNGRKSRIYKWGNDDFTSFIDVTVEGGKVTEKKNKGLK